MILQDTHAHTNNPSVVTLRTQNYCRHHFYKDDEYGDDGEGQSWVWLHPNEKFQSFQNLGRIHNPPILTDSFITINLIFVFVFGLVFVGKTFTP